MNYFNGKGKSKKFALQHAMKAQRERGIAPPFLNLDAKWWWVVNATPWWPYPRKETQYQ
jgi:hypothetical protein